MCFIINDMSYRDINLSMAVNKAHTQVPATRTHSTDAIVNMSLLVIGKS